MRSKFWNAMLRRRNTHFRPWLYFVADVQDARLKKGRCLLRGEWNDGHWQLLVKDLPGINFMMPV